MDKRTYAVVLAAGSATRYGSTKQLAEIDGTSLVARAVQTANAACAGRSVVVLGHDAPRVAGALRPADGFAVVNDRYEDGLGTSLARAVASVRHVAGAVVVMLADQPGVSAQHIRNLQQAWGGQQDEIVATAFGGTLGPPVLFASGCFDELQKLAGDAGGKHLFDDERFRLATIAFEPASLDVDTPDDLRQI